MENIQNIKIDQQKFEAFVCELFKKLEQSNTFFVTDSKYRENGIDIYSPAKNIAVQCRKNENGKTSKQLFSEIMGELKQNFEKHYKSNIKLNKLVLISTYRNDELIFEYIKFLKIENKYQFEIEYWGWETISQYLKEYEYLLANEEDTKPKELSKFITDVPALKLYQTFGIDAVIEQIDNELEKQTDQKLVIYNYADAVGKSTAILAYIKTQKYQNKYKHIVWIDCFEDILISFFVALKDFYKYNNNLEVLENFYNIYQKIKQIEGNNLLIINNITSISQFDLIDDFIRKINWKVVITSKLKLPESVNFKLPDLSSNSAMQILNFYNKNIQNEIIMNKIFETVNNNPYLITLFSKFLITNPNLSENDLYELILEKDRRIPHLKNLISETAPKEEVFWQRQALKYLLAIYEFEQKKLNSLEKYYLTILCLFPDKEFTADEISDLLALNSKDKEELSNVLVDLISKNWLQVSHNKFKIEGLLKKVLQKKLKPNSKKAKLLLEQLIKATYKAENNNSLFFEYLPFCEKYIEILEDDSPNIAVLTNNIALIYERINDDYHAQKYYVKTIEIEEKYLIDADDEILENISHLYVKTNNLNKAEEYALEVLNIRKQTLNESDIKIADIYKSLAIIYYKREDFEKSLENIDLALDIYKEIYAHDSYELTQANSIHEYISYAYEENMRKKNKWFWFNKYFR